MFIYIESDLYGTALLGILANDRNYTAMDVLCVSTNLTSSEWAAWVQAVGSIIAVISAAGIAIWQSHKQHQSALALHKTEQRHARLEAAKTLLALCRNCAIAAEHFSKQLGDRESVHKIASGEMHFDFEELQALQNGVSGIPLYQLPDVLVSPAMILAANLRQLRQTVEITVKAHRSMDANDFEEFFKTMSELAGSLELTRQDIEKDVQTMKENA